MRNPITICGIHLHFADSTYNLRIPLTVVDSATAQCNYTHVLLFVCGFHTVLASANTVADSANSPSLERSCAVQCFKYLFEESKTQRRSKKSSIVSNSPTNLILACCGIRLQCTEYTVWPRNVNCKSFSSNFRNFDLILYFFN